MILVTTGTNEQPFDRLVRAAWALAGDERLVVQHGSSRVPHGPGEWVDFLPFEELAALAREARVVVSHAGVGSIMLARSAWQRPVVVPRRHHLGEAVDDHQVPLARRLHAAGLVTLVEDDSRLADAVFAAPPVSPLGPAVPVSGRGELTAELRTLISGFGARASTHA